MNLSCNKITSVPHLRLMAAHRHFTMSAVNITKQEQKQFLFNNQKVDEKTETIKQDVNEAAMEIMTKQEAKVDVPDKGIEDVEQDGEENVGSLEEQKDDMADANDTLLDGFENVLSQISTEAAIESNELLDFNFGNETGFDLSHKPDELELDFGEDDCEENTIRNEHSFGCMGGQDGKMPGKKSRDLFLSN